MHGRTSDAPAPFDRAKLRDDLGALARRGVFLGTSSWKYPGWCGQLYDEARYLWRGRFSEARFDRGCLAEYAGVFRTVGVDAAYYKFPDRRYLETLMAEVPAGFEFSFKVTDAITIKKFANLPRFGARAGQPNENFLNADLFASAFLEPCAPFQDRIGVLMFEFSKFYPSDFARGRDFLAVLEPFLARLPRGWRYGVEIRNQTFLHADYFALLARHGVAHLYNSWQDMPPVEEQMALPGSRTADFSIARFLLRPGRKYEEAVKRFSPYAELKEPYPEGRHAAATLVRQTASAPTPGRAYLYFNNRFEGNALATIRAVIDEATTR